MAPQIVPPQVFETFIPSLNEWRKASKIRLPEVKSRGAHLAKQGGFLFKCQAATSEPNVNELEY